MEVDLFSVAQLTEALRPNHLKLSAGNSSTGQMLANAKKKSVAISKT